MEQPATKPNLIFWLLAVVFLLWNMIGCAGYLVERLMSEAAYLEAYGPEMAAARDVYPIWATAAYAVAVWGGLLASVLFLLRKRLSVSLFAISLLAAVIGFVPIFTNEILRAAGGSTFWVMPAIVIIIGVFELYYGRLQRSKGVLR